MKSGEILCDPEHTDSHEDLLVANNIRDGHAQRGRFARIEFTPPPHDQDITDLSLWKAKIDESEVPEWFDRVSVREKMEAIVRRMIVDDERPLLLGGCWIVVGDAKIRKVLGARLVMVWGNATVSHVRGNATVSDVWGNATVSDVRGNATVSDVGGNATVSDVGDNATVSHVRDNAKIINDHRGQK
jgi:hypothetical protein